MARVGQQRHGGGGGSQHKKSEGSVTAGHTMSNLRAAGSRPVIYSTKITATKWRQRK